MTPTPPPSDRPHPPDWRALYGELDRCLPTDRRELRRRIGRMRKTWPKGAASLQALRTRLDDARRRAEARTANRPVPTYPEDLPVSQHRDIIRDAVREHPVVVIAGETGSGKTTQLPKICLDAGRGSAGLIGITQPRRIAAVSVAERVASEMNAPLGDTVGYQIRFEARVAEATYIKFMTDGILLAETQTDRDLLAYDTLILDEAHERSLNIDFLLGYLKRLLEKRRDLKVIVSSATLDVERISAFFDDAPILRVEGRTYPVDLRYRSPDEEEPDLPPCIGEALEATLPELESGDALVFLPGERDIRETADNLSRRPALQSCEILPLFGRLSASDQRKVFRPGKARRIVLATNVAETSVTVPRIRIVVDTGLARVKRFSHRTQVERLLIEPVSQASANQRKGRCGRIGPGICVRLYGEEDFADRPAFTDPEICRTSLAEVILQMNSMRLGKVESFPFLDPPAPALIRAGYAELLELGALDDRKRLTAVGKRMARLPIEPRFARMLLEAQGRSALREVLVIAAALSIQDPRNRPMDQKQAADRAHAEWKDERSDFMAYLNLWTTFRNETRALRSGNQARKWCRDRFLSFMRMREWRDVREQLADAMGEQGAKPNRAAADYEAIHRSLLAGLLARTGRHDENGIYDGARGTRFYLWPGSGLAGSTPKWVMAGEVVETSRLFARDVAAVEPEWIESAAGSLAKRTYSDPHWDERGGVARAFEQVSVFGLPVIEKRRMHYGPVDPDEARRLLIREGLVRGHIGERLPFLARNRELIEQVAKAQDRLRRGDLLVDEDHLHAWFDQRVPRDVYTAKALARWWHKVSKKQPDLLFLSKDDVRAVPYSGLDESRFPSILAVEDLRLPLEYTFDPGHDRDGVTCTVPVGVLPRLERWRLEWLVPGLLGEKVALLLRSLPRRYRRELQPLPDTVEACLDTLSPGRRPLLEDLADAVRAVRGVRAEPSDFRPETLPPHLRMNIRVVDAEDRPVQEGRDLDSLRTRFRDDARRTFVQAPRERYERTGIRTWDVGDLPERMDLSDGRGAVWGYPALADEGDNVALRLFDDPRRASAAMTGGLVRLFRLALQKECRLAGGALPLSERALAVYGSIGGEGDELRDAILDRTVEAVFVQDQPHPRSAEAFAERLRAGRAGLHRTAVEAGRAVSDALEKALSIHKALVPEPPSALAASIDDMRSQLQHLVYPGFMGETPVEAARHMPRYLEAMEMRLERLRTHPARDRQRTDLVARHEKRYREHRSQPREDDDREALRTYRWMIEEYRVSLFAQELGTAGKVSEKRLDEAWRKVSGG